MSGAEDKLLAHMSGAEDKLLAHMSGAEDKLLAHMSGAEDKSDDKDAAERQKRDQRSMNATMNHMAMNVACNTVVVGTRPVMLVGVTNS